MAQLITSSFNSWSTNGIPVYGGQGFSGWIFSRGGGNQSGGTIQKTFSQEEGTSSTVNFNLGVNGSSPNEFSRYTYKVEILNSSNQVLASNSGSVQTPTGPGGQAFSLNFTSPNNSEGPFTVKFTQTGQSGEQGSHDLVVTSASINGTAADGVVGSPLDYIVSGTAGDDLIDTSYTGDPNGDKVDNNDAKNGSDDDVIQAGAGNDTVVAGDGNDNIDGGTGNDDIKGNAGDDVIDGGDGADKIHGGVGDDQIEGGAGNDTIRGGVGNDTISGGDGNDLILGLAGNNMLDGGDGNDTIEGAVGNDTIKGGDGNDSIKGGDGNDLFIYQAGDGADTISDFNVGNSGSIDDGDTTNNDHIDLSSFYNATTLAAVNAAGGSYVNAQTMMRDDAADGTLDGVIGGKDYSDEIGDINLKLQDGSGGAVTGNNLTFDNTNVACFCQGTNIKTNKGEKAVEDLEPGDLVLTKDCGYKKLLLVLGGTIDRQTLVANPKLLPVKITAGAMGQGLPRRDLWVSRQHRMVISSVISSSMFGLSQVLVSAIRLTELPGIYVDKRATSVEYFHLVFEDHQIIYANDALSESFYPGKEGLNALSSGDRKELSTLFSEGHLRQIHRHPARPIPSNKLQKQLIERHNNKNNPLTDNPAIFTKAFSAAS
jgi:Ca2+-binding RTX toxin-like protein